MRAFIILGVLLAACTPWERDNATGAPDASRACVTRTDCGPDHVCINQVCRPGECERREECPDPLDQICDENFQCLPSPFICSDCGCPNGDSDCGLGEFCSAGTCYGTTDRTSCTRSSQCAPEDRCDPRAGFCVPNKGGCDRCSEYPELCCTAEESCDPETKRCNR